MMKNACYSVEFFDLQLRFAAKVAELAGVSFAEAVGSHTNIYVRLGMGERLDVANPDWQDYVSALVKADEPAKWTHHVHLQRIRLPTGPALSASVGCFSYAVTEPGCARLHFHAGGEHFEAPLSAANRQLREEELASLLAKLKASFGNDIFLIGASWLYNLEAYRRLFPNSYLASLRALAHPYQRMPLWGQFLNRDRSVRSEAASRFLSSVANAACLPESSACFPLSVLSTRAPASWLYEHVGV